MDGGGGGGSRFDRDLHRVFQVFLGHAPDACRHGGGEQGDLPFFGQLGQDPFHIVDKAHIEHLVGLIQDQAADIFHLQALAADMVHDPPRGADDNLRPALELAELGGVILTAEDGHGLQALHMGAIGLEGLGDLQGKLPGGGQNQDLRLFEPEVEVGQQRQGKGRRLAGAGLGLSDHITARQNMGNHFHLDRGRSFVPGVIQGLHKGFAEIKV